jgi:hypothetical protein
MTGRGTRRRSDIFEAQLDGDLRHLSPDLAATILRTATSGAEVWSEWEMRGTDAAGAQVTLSGGRADHRDGGIAPL